MLKTVFEIKKTKKTDLYYHLLESIAYVIYVP